MHVLTHAEGRARRRTHTRARSSERAHTLAARDAARECQRAEYNCVSVRNERLVVGIPASSSSHCLYFPSLMSSRRWPTARTFERSSKASTASAARTICDRRSGKRRGRRESPISMANKERGTHTDTVSALPLPLLLLHSAFSFDFRAETDRSTH